MCQCKNGSRPKKVWKPLLLTSKVLLPSHFPSYNMMSYRHTISVYQCEKNGYSTCYCVAINRETARKGQKTDHRQKSCVSVSRGLTHTHTHTHTHTPLAHLEETPHVKPAAGGVDELMWRAALRLPARDTQLGFMGTKSSREQYISQRPRAGGAFRSRARLSLSWPGPGASDQT